MGYEFTYHFFFLMCLLVLKEENRIDFDTVEH